jgi:hypothetical protein
MRFAVATRRAERAQRTLKRSDCAHQTQTLPSINDPKGIGDLMRTIDG